MKTTKTIIFLLLVSFSYNSLFAQLTENRESSPYNAKFIYKDIKNFIKAYNHLTKESDTIKVIREKYFDKGTDGLKEFINNII